MEKNANTVEYQKVEDNFTFEFVKTIFASSFLTKTFSENASRKN